MPFKTSKILMTCLYHEKHISEYHLRFKPKNYLLLTVFGDYIVYLNINITYKEMMYLELLRAFCGESEWGLLRRFSFAKRDPDR